MQAELARQYELKRHVINLMRSRLLAETFASWATVVGAEGRRLEVMRPFVNMITNRSLTVHFDGWRDEIARQRRLLKQYAAKIAHTLLAKTFGAWANDVHASHEKDARSRQVAAEAVMRLSKKSLVLTFFAWHGWLVEARAAMEKAIARWGSAGAGAAFEKWVEHVAERKRCVERLTN